MTRHRPSDPGRVVGDGGPAGSSAPVGPAGYTPEQITRLLLDWAEYRHIVPGWVVRAWHGFPCCDRDPVSGFLCEKPPGHHLFRDGRRFHHANERHTGEMARTYPATWVHIWTTVRSVTTTSEPIRL